MGNRSSGATVVDLAAFRERKRMREANEAPAPQATAVLVPVWFCWVPVFAPQMM